MPSPGHFAMTKWYLDCVSDAGDAAIVYCADLHWRGIHAQMGSVLEKPDAQPARTRSSMGKYAVSIAANEISVDHPRLKFSGRWISAAPASEHALYESENGAITWKCLQPSSQVTASLGGRAFAGLGYAECLVLTVPPWQLPMRELRWGRFVSERHSLVWIRWRGPHTVDLALCNGETCILIAASQSEVLAGDAVLEIPSGVILRDGRLRNTILPGLPAIAKLFPHSIFNVVETKWLSPATLRMGGEKSTGWAIHEVVQFGEVHLSDRQV
jgi:hypothetical protein